MGSSHHRLKGFATIKIVRELKAHEQPDNGLLAGSLLLVDGCAFMLEVSCRRFLFF